MLTKIKFQHDLQYAYKGRDSFLQEFLQRMRYLERNKLNTSHNRLNNEVETRNEEKIQKLLVFFAKMFFFLFSNNNKVKIN